MGDDSLELLPEDVILGRAIPPEMVHDLRVIAQLDARTVGRVAEYLSQLEGFAQTESLKAGLLGCIQNSNADLADCIVRTLVNVKPSDVARTLKTIDRWRQSTEERKDAFSDDLFACLGRNLQVLVADYASIALLRKANHLLREVGNEFESVAYFCDMRPVFDSARKNVEGAVMLANMRLIYVTQTGQRHACALALTEEELCRLVKTSEEALDKLDVLKAASAKIGGITRTTGGPA